MTVSYTSVRGQMTQGRKISVPISRLARVRLSQHCQSRQTLDQQPSSILHAHSVRQNLTHTQPTVESIRTSSPDTSEGRIKERKEDVRKSYRFQLRRTRHRSVRCKP
jgi:hypothetical protein